MSYKISQLVEAIDKLICLRVSQGQPGYHLPKGTIEEAQDELYDALAEIKYHEDSET